jgi:hypothetical protein
MKISVLSLLLVLIHPLAARAQGDCGPNSPRVGDGVFFDEIDISGVRANKNDVKLVRATKGGVPVTLGVRDGQELFFPANPGTSVRGTNLVFEHLPSGAQYTVIVRGVARVPFVAADSELLPAYELIWKKTRAARRPELLPRHQCGLRRPDPVSATTDPVCQATDIVVPPPKDLERPDEGRPNPGSNRETRKESNELIFFKHRGHVVVFQRDQYDNQKRLVIPSLPPGTSWLNFACLATSMAKMHLHRHTERGANTAGGSTHQTQMNQRTTLLKMFTADYYGVGHPFTSEGTYIRYSNAPDWFGKIRVFDNASAPTAEELDRFEAIWTEKGAHCLNRPRKFDWSEIIAYGNAHGLRVPPRCKEIEMKDWKAVKGAYAATALPPGSPTPPLPPVGPPTPASILPPGRRP